MDELGASVERVEELGGGVLQSGGTRGLVQGLLVGGRF